MSRSTFVYCIYIRTTPDALWAALTDQHFIGQYWFGMHAQSDFETGSPWKLSFADGRPADSGQIIAATRPSKLSICWRNEWNAEFREEGDSICTFEIESASEGPSVVKLTVTHTMDRPQSKLVAAVSGGWPKILSNLKSLLETGSPVLIPTS